MADDAVITPELCRQLIAYDPSTGAMSWLARDLTPKLVRGHRLLLRLALLDRVHDGIIVYDPVADHLRQQRDDCIFFHSIDVYQISSGC